MQDQGNHGNQLPLLHVGRRYLEVSSKRNSEAADDEGPQASTVQPLGVYSVFQLKVSEDGNDEPSRKKLNIKHVWLYVFLTR